MPAPLRLRRVAFRLLRWSGAPYLLRELLQRRRLTIVVYHDPDPATFERHLDVFRRLYSIVSLRSGVDAVEAGDLTALPPKPLAITLDDGNRRNVQLLALLERLGVPVTIFLCSSIVGSSRRFWFEHAADVERLKLIQDEERVALLRAQGFDEADETHEREALSDAEIRELTHPLVDLQSHGRTHAILPRCADPKAWSEIAESRSELVARHGLDVYAFAYPNGDYSERDVAYVRDAGYRCALTVDRGSNPGGADVFRLRRLGIDDLDGVDEVVVKSSGLWSALRRR